MATSTQPVIDRTELVQRAPLVGAGSVAILLIGLGAGSVLAGNAPGFQLRLPGYVLAGAVAFVGALVAMRHSRHDGRTVLLRAVLVGVGGLIAVGFGTEGLVYALVFAMPDLSVYALSVVVVGCGLGYWSVRNWRVVNDMTRPW